MEELIPIIVGIIGAITVRIIKKAISEDQKSPAPPTLNPQRQVQSQQPIQKPIPQALEEIFPEPKVEMPQRPQPIVEKKPVAQKPIEVENETTEKKGKIDPKKLIVYSEIMNRKY